MCYLVHLLEFEEARIRRGDLCHLCLLFRGRVNLSCLGSFSWWIVPLEILHMCFELLPVSDSFLGQLESLSALLDLSDFIKEVLDGPNEVCLYQLVD